mgnify:FL=1
MKLEALALDRKRPSGFGLVDASSVTPLFSAQKRWSTVLALSKTRPTPRARAYLVIMPVYLAILALAGGCSLASPSSRQSQVLDTKLNAVAEKVEALTQVVVNAPSQTVNQLWPLVALLLGLGALALVGIMWWIARKSYVGQFAKIAELKAQACRNGAKT